MKATRPVEIDVAAGVLLDDRGRALISQRPAGKHEAGSWEFPGGKIRSSESPFEALGRELREELGIRIVEAEFLVTYAHDYPDRRVNLHIWRIVRWSGQPGSKEGQPLKWVAIAELMDAGLLPADLKIVEVLQQIVNSNSTL